MKNPLKRKERITDVHANYKFDMNTYSGCEKWTSQKEILDKNLKRIFDGYSDDIIIDKDSSCRSSQYKFYKKDGKEKSGRKYIGTLDIEPSRIFLFAHYDYIDDYKKIKADIDGELKTELKNGTIPKLESVNEDLSKYTPTYRQLIKEDFEKHASRLEEKHPKLSRILWNPAFLPSAAGIGFIGLSAYFFLTGSPGQGIVSGLGATFLELGGLCIDEIKK